MPRQPAITATERRDVIPGTLRVGDNARSLMAIRTAQTL